MRSILIVAICLGTILFVRPIPGPTIGGIVEAQEKAVPKPPQSKDHTPSDTPAPVIKKDPVVLITGPVQKDFGRSAILKLVITGQDLRIKCLPDNEDWNLVKFYDDSLGILFDPQKEGTYVFSAAVNQNNKTAVAMHAITIGRAVPPGPVPPGPNPPDPPGPGPTDPWVAKLQSAFKTDLAAGVGTDEQRKKLLASYKQGAMNFIDNSSLNADLLKQQKQLNEAAIGAGTLPQVRAVIGAEVVTSLTSNTQLPLDKAKAKVTWAKIVDGLTKLTP